MTNQRDVLENVEHETVEYYKRALKRIVIDKKSTFPLPSSDLDEYIAVFSLYMRSSNEAYKYNLPYLSHQHKKFWSFLKSAIGKYDLFCTILMGIKKAATIQQFIKENPQESRKVIISLNDFFISDLSGVLDFHEAFSISGAERLPKYDVLTIQYIIDGKKKIRLCRNLINTDKNEINIDKIVDLTEKVIGINRTKQEEFNNGNA